MGAGCLRASPPYVSEHEYLPTTHGHTPQHSVTATIYTMTCTSGCLRASPPYVSEHEYLPTTHGHTPQHSVTATIYTMTCTSGCLRVCPPSVFDGTVNQEFESTLNSNCILKQGYQTICCNKSKYYLIGFYGYHMFFHRDLKSK